MTDFTEQIRLYEPHRRQPRIAAIGGGVEGVTRYWQQMQGQLVQAMLLTGCASLADVREHIIYRG